MGGSDSTQGNIRYAGKGVVPGTKVTVVVIVLGVAVCVRVRVLVVVVVVDVELFKKIIVVGYCHRSPPNFLSAGTIS